MTELFVTKAIVKLPRKNNRLSSLVVDTTSDYNAVVSSSSSAKPHQQEDGFYLVTDKLYIDGLPSSVIENEIMDLVSSCDPIKIHLKRNHDFASGYIQFISKEMADRAYTLLNGVTFRAGIRLQLKINPPLGDYPEPEAHAGILHIKNLPSHINNKSLYDLFRPFGPMILCKILVEQGSTFKGTALVQYFNSQDAQDAEISMNNKPMQNNIITAFPFVSSKLRSSSIIETEDNNMPNNNNRYSTTTNITIPTSPLPPAPSPMITTSSSSPPIRSDGSSMVDYTNLYIKNLDLNVKSADLFNSFRKFGRIISARVMKNAQTKQSKGFGFVSFSKAEEAQKAKQDMNGEYILSKPVIVAFHEPKKPRDNNSSTSPTESSTFEQRASPPPPPIPSFTTTTTTTTTTSPPNNLFVEQQQNNYYMNNGYQLQNNNNLSNNNNHNRTRDFIDHRYSNNNNNVTTIIPQQQQQQKYNSYQQDYQTVTMTNGTNKGGYQTMERNNSSNNNRHSHSNNNTNSFSNNHNNGIYDHRQQQQQQQIHNIPQQQPIIKHHEHHFSNGNNIQHHTPLKRDLSGSGNMINNNYQPSLSALASGAFINTPPSTTTTTTNGYYPQPPPPPVNTTATTTRPTFRRRGSVESVASVMTETSSQTRRHTVTKAVLAIEKSDNVHDIVDMLLTLKKKDLATCLFNKVFLKAKIRQAKDALDIFQEQQQRQNDDDSDDDIVVTTTATTATTRKNNTMETNGYYKKEIYNNNVLTFPPRSSRAIPIVAPPSQQKNYTATATTTTTTTVATNGQTPKLLNPVVLNDKELGEEIDKFLKTLNGLTLHEKKQLLGDRLFPLVKSTGVKQAPKITIRLLDSVPLDELAYSMYDKDKLKHQVSQVVATIPTAGY